MLGLPFPTYLGWFLSPGIMIVTFCISFGFYKRCVKEEAAKKSKNKE